MTKHIIARSFCLAAILAVAASAASAENITGSTKIRDVTQKVDVKGNQIVAAIGKDATAMNLNAGLFAKDAAKVNQTVNVKGNQIVAAIGVKALAVNANAVIAGGISR